MKKSQYVLNTILIVILIVWLFFLYTHVKSTDYANSTVKTRVNTDTVAPKELFLESWKLLEKKYYDKKMNNQNWAYWKRHYLKHIKTEEDAYIAINSMLASLDDPYSRFLDPKEFNEQNVDIDAKINGVGINIYMGSGKAVIVGLIDGSPALSAGLKVGDIILKVDDKEINGKNVHDVALSIRGEKDTFVKLELLRDNKKITKKLQRKEIKIRSVQSKALEPDIGYIKITSFMSGSLPEEFGEALKKVDNSKGLIIDLRNNPGGILNNAVILANTFIDSGTIVSIDDGKGYHEEIDANPNWPHLTIPTVILVNQGSASASEIFSGAMKDYNRAILVGEKTFGKGMVQRIYPLPNQAGINITTAKYLTPNGADINKKGIEPHYSVKNDITKSEEDKQLDKAIAILKDMM